MFKHFRSVRLVRLMSALVLVAVLGVGVIEAFQSTPVQADGPTRGWSQGMWQATLQPNQYDCVRHWWGYEHCRQIVTGLRFHPDTPTCPDKAKVNGRCWYITYNNQVQNLALKYEDKHPGYSDFRFGVPTHWLKWGPGSAWRFRLVDGSKW